MYKPKELSYEQQFPPMFSYEFAAQIITMHSAKEILSISFNHVSDMHEK